MKTLTQILTPAACVFLAVAAHTVNVSAQNGTQLIKITVTYNYNMPAQAPATFVLTFDGNGNEALAFPDAGNEASLGHYSDEVFPFSVSSDGFNITSQDARPELLSYRTIPFGFVTKTAGDIKVVAEVSSSDPATPAPGFVWLEQISTGERYSILDTTKFTLAANPNFATDFILHTGTRASSSPTHESCFNYADGSIAVYGPNYNNFTLELYQGAGQIINAVVAGTDTTINNLAAGNYVSVIRIAGIPVDSSDVVINAATPLTADFLSDYNWVAPNTTVNFTDNSVGGLNYTWDFGDGDTTYTAGSESHAYLNTGSYQVTLTVSDANGCTSSAFDFITVDNAPAPMQNNPFNNNSQSSFNSTGNNSFSATPEYTGDRCFYSNQRIVIDLGEINGTTVSVRSMNGAVIYTGAQDETHGEYNLPAAGAYVVTIQHADGTAESHIIMAQF